MTRSLVIVRVMRWKKPSWYDEYAEFERVRDEEEISFDALEAAFLAGSLETIPGWVWCTLQNTDSSNLFSVAEAEAWAARHGDAKRLDRIIQGLVGTDVLPAPIILKSLKGGRPYLVAGNRRLVACRVLNLQPSVWLM